MIYSCNRDCVHKNEFISYSGIFAKLGLHEEASFEFQTIRNIFSPRYTFHDAILPESVNKAQIKACYWPDFLFCNCSNDKRFMGYTEHFTIH